MPGARRGSAVLLFLLLVLLAFTIRGVTATQLIPHVDEAATMLATEMVATKGVPVFPSGVLYLQGASLSYLLAPLTAVIGGTIDQLTALRFVNVLMGTGVVLLTALLGARIARHWVPGVIAGLIVAFDPASIAWSVYLRPYAALSLVTVALAYAVVCLVMDEPRRDRRWWRDPVVWIVVLFVLGTLTHISIWLVYPAVGLIAVLTWGFGLLGPQRRVTIGLGVVAIALVLFLVLNSVVGPGSSTSSGESGPSFVGSHLLTFERLFSTEVRLEIWTSLFHGSGLSTVMPLVLTACSGVLLGRVSQHGRERDPAKRRALGAVLMLYWVPVGAAIGLIGAEGHHRYLIHVVPLGAIIIALAVYILFEELNVLRPRLPMILPALGVAALLLSVFFYSVIATTWRVGYRGPDADYFAAMTYVAEHYKPGQAIIVALPPIAHVSLNEDARRDLWFLAGASGDARVTRYTWQDAEGNLVDFWLGRNAIGSTDGLCGMLASSTETSWIVVDRWRLDHPYEGEMESVIEGATNLVARGANGVHVRTSIPVEQWAASAVQTCIANGMRPPEPISEDAEI